MSIRVKIYIPIMKHQRRVNIPSFHKKYVAKPITPRVIKINRAHVHFLSLMPMLFTLVLSSLILYIGAQREMVLNVKRRKISQWQIRALMSGKFWSIEV